MPAVSNVFRFFSVRSLALLLLVSLIGTGCSTKKPDTGGGGGDGASSSDTLRVVLSAALTTLDPAKISDIGGFEALENVFEGLVRINANNEIEPCLAEKWDISKDGKVYTFHLRHGVKFHNGREMQAADFKYSVERALLPETKSNVAINYITGVLGVEEMKNKQRRDLPGVVVLDPYTLQITLDRPRGFFLQMLSYPTNDVVCREAVEKTNGQIETTAAMIGTGPYKVESYQPGQQFTLVAHADYWEGRPKMARIEMPIILNPDTAYDNFRTHQVDLYAGTLIPFSRYAQDKEANALQPEWVNPPIASIDYLVMHEKLQPAFANKKVRQAFAMAIDRATILRVAYKDVCKQANGLLPPQLLNGRNEPPAIPFDVPKAKQLLAEAGYPDGKGFPTLTLSVLDKTPHWAEACQIIRKDLQDNLGITVELRTLESTQYSADTDTEKLEFFYYGWIADYPDPQDFLSTLFVTKNGNLNRLAYSNPAFDSLCNQGDAETGTAKRAALYAQANTILMDDAAVVPIAYITRPMLIQQNIKGWRMNVCAFLPLNTITKTK